MRQKKGKIKVWEEGEGERTRRNKKENEENYNS